MNPITDEQVQQLYNLAVAIFPDDKRELDNELRPLPPLPLHSKEVFKKDNNRKFECITVWLSIAIHRRRANGELANG